MKRAKIIKHNEPLVIQEDKIPTPPADGLVVKVSAIYNCKVAKKFSTKDFGTIN